jgi:hypothetical protein
VKDARAHIKRLHLSDENTGSGHCLNPDSEDKLAEEKPSVQNIYFSDSNESYSDEHADSTWRMEGTSRQL